MSISASKLTNMEATSLNADDFGSSFQNLNSVRLLVCDAYHRTLEERTRATLAGAEALLGMEMIYHSQCLDLLRGSQTPVAPRNLVETLVAAIDDPEDATEVADRALGVCGPGSLYTLGFHKALRAMIRALAARLDELEAAS